MQAGMYSRSFGMLLVCLMDGAVLGAQQPADVQSENGVYTLHADTHLVLLDVTVTDNHGHPVTGLTKDDFKLLEDGQPQTIKFFEEHAPVDSAEIARQKAAALAGQPPNTFTNYEPFTGRPVTVLLLNELFPLPVRDFNPLHPELSPLRQRMIDTVQSAPPDTPFAVYLLDSELQLVQPVTTDRALLLARINVLWKTPQFGSERMINPNGKLDFRGTPPAEDIPVRRSIMSDAMQHLASSLKGEPGRKSLYVFTGGFHCTVVGPGKEFLPDCPDIPFPNDTMDYLCGLMDTLEQGRMSIYRVYPMPGEIGYGFGCPASADLGTSANYYTLYYTPTNGDWNGKYRETTVEVADKKGLHLAYRKGYYGTPENAEAHYYTAQRPAAVPVVPASGGVGSNGPTIAATTVAPATADSESLGTGDTEAKSTQQILLRRRGAESLGTGAAPVTPTPSAAVFSVQVIPADTTVVPAIAARATDKEKQTQKQEQEYRQLMLRLSMPASEFKVMPSDSGQYVARLQISAVGYAGGRLASSNGSQAVQMEVNFNGATDPRIATSTITATLTLNVLEHDKSRWLLVTVRDLATGQLGSMVIPMEQVKMPGKQ
jgi:VWFA-related protein